MISDGNIAGFWRQGKSLALCFLFLSLLPGAALAQSEVPFDFFHNEMVVSVTINAHGPYVMLLDTGTNPSVIDLTLAKQLKLKINPVGGQGSGGGTAANPAYGTALPSVTMGNFAATNIAALAVDLSPLSRKFGRKIDGVLGNSLFQNRVVQFDYPHQIARFYAKSPYPRADAAQAALYVMLPFRYHDDIILSGIVVNNRQATATLDTGSNGTFTLTPQATKKLGLEAEAAQAQVKSGAGFNGAYQSRSGLIGDIAIGSKITAVSPKVVFWLPGTGHDDEPWDIDIGNAFLRNFVLTIDYKTHTVIFERS